MYDCRQNVTIDLFRHKTLLNKLKNLPRFYSAKMGASEKAMAFISRVRQLAADCKAMEVVIGNQEMTVLCGLPQMYDQFIETIDASADDMSLSLDFVKSRLLQEEQRMLDRDDIKPASNADLIGNPQGVNHLVCGLYHKPNDTHPNCWTKYAQLRPKKVKGRSHYLPPQHKIRFVPLNQTQM